MSYVKALVTEKDDNGTIVVVEGNTYEQLTKAEAIERYVPEHESHIFDFYCIMLEMKNGIGGYIFIVDGIGGLHALSKGDFVEVAE